MCRAAVQNNRTQSCMLTLKKLHADAKTADIRMVGWGSGASRQPGTLGQLPAATMAEQTNIFLTDNRAI